MLLVAGYLYYCFALDLSWHKCKEHSYFPSNSGPFTLFTLRSLSDIIFTLAYTLSLTYFPYFVYVCLVFPGSNFIKVTRATSCYFENVCVYWWCLEDLLFLFFSPHIRGKSSAKADFSLCRGEKPWHMERSDRQDVSRWRSVRWGPNRMPHKFEVWEIEFKKNENCIKLFFN